MTAAVQFAIPDSTAAAAFTAGELAVGPATSAVAAATRNFARYFIFAPGTYTVKLWAASVATVWVGTEPASLRRVGIHSNNSAPTTFDVYVTGGLHRVDVTLLNMVTTLAGFVMSISKDGRTVYASSASGWVWSTSVVADADIPSAGDVRLTYPVWTVTPNWNDGVTERLEWLTEVIPSEVDVEQRRSLRRYPRRSLEASFLRSGVAWQRINNFIVGVGLSKLLVPLWFEQLRTVSVVSGNTIVWPQGTLDQREFVAGELLLFQGTDPADYELANILSVSSSTVTLTAATARTWAVGTRVTPLRVARFDSLPSLRTVTDRAASVQIRFNLDDPVRNISPSWGYCSPLWRFKTDRSEDFTIDYSRTTYTIDVETGRVDVIDPGGRSRIGTKASLKLVGRAALWSYRQFLMQARGKSQRFWWPSGMHDVEPVGTIGGITLDVAQAGYSAWMTQPQDARLMIGIVFSDGRPSIYRKIASVQSMGAFDRFTLTQAMPSMSRSEIARLQFVLPVRFDQDAFELHHITDDAKVVRASVAVRSSDIEGMPDIDCWITSQPYPLEDVEGIQMSAAVTGGTLGGIPMQVLALDMAAAVTGGSFPMTVVYRSAEIAAEGIDMAASVTGGSFPMTVSYRSSTMDTEGIDVAATVTGGSLQALLISTTLDTEAVQLSAAVIGGTLS